MTIPSELLKMLKERTMKRRQEFRQQNCCNFSENDVITRSKLTDCLEKAKQLIDDYGAIYSDDLDDSGVKHLVRGLNFRKNNFQQTYDKLKENKDNSDIFQIQHCLKLAYDCITEYETLLKDFGFHEFDSVNT
ncbi:MAG: hypothetical protein IIC67_11520 [Thaumarchaeota archaeon]|nr:hypothetical protein [Nitrososphaerota archaeon]